MVISDLKTCGLKNIDDDSLVEYAREADDYIYRWLLKNYPSYISTSNITASNGDTIPARRIVRVLPSGEEFGIPGGDCCTPCLSISSTYCDFSFNKDTNIITIGDEDEHTIEYLPNGDSLLLGDDFAPLYREYVKMLKERCCRDDVDQGQISFHMQWIDFYLKELGEFIEASDCGEFTSVQMNNICLNNYV